MRSAGLFVFAVFTLCAAPATAEPVQVNWEGVVTGINYAAMYASDLMPASLQVGSVMNGSFVYDTSATGVPYAPCGVEYAFPTQPFTLNFAGEPVNVTAGFKANVNNDFVDPFDPLDPFLGGPGLPPYDQLLFFSDISQLQEGEFAYTISLWDQDATAIDSLDLPSAIDAAMFGEFEWLDVDFERVFNGQRRGGVFTGQITSFTATPLNSPTSPVPEPTSLAIFGTLALGGCLVAARRRRKVRA